MSVLRLAATINWKQDDFCNNTFYESNNRKQRVYCQHVFGGGLLPDIRARCQHHSWTLQQDGAPLHTARNTPTYLRCENVTFIEPDIMWHVAPKQPGLESSRLHCLGCHSADSLSTSTIHNNQPAKASDRYWVGQTLAAFHWSRHWSVASPAWVRRPAAKRTHWTFDVKTAWRDSYFWQ